MDNLDKLSILVDKEWCQQALTNADEFEEALGLLVGALDDRVIPPTAIWAANRMAAAIRELHRLLATAKAELESIDDSLSGQESFCGERAVAIESLKARLESKSQQLATAKTEGAAEALEAMPCTCKYIRAPWLMSEAALKARASIEHKICVRCQRLNDVRAAAIDAARAGGGK